MLGELRESDSEFSLRIADFEKSLPYRDHPYSSRSWGHPLHSLCSYQGKLKPSLAYWLIKQFTEPGDTVIDPLSGVGTIPLEAALLGRPSIGNDLSPLAATVTRAKLDPPTIDEAHETLDLLANAMEKIDLTEADMAETNFGLNATVRDYYHPRTLDEVMRARRVFLTEGLTGRGSAFIWSSLLHVLHGNRPYAISRTSHPITPFNPTGPFEYRSVIAKTRERVDRALTQPMPAGFIPGRGIMGDFRNLTSQIDNTSRAAAVITSPPFLGMRFDRPNWLRLWFCGWNADDFHKKSLGFIERQQTKSLDCYEDFYDVCGKLLQADGLLVVHIGSGKKDRLVDGLRNLAQRQFRLIGETVEDVASLERHGLSDKGSRTTSHHLLFFRRN